jgi:hypothetical protein
MAAGASNDPKPHANQGQTRSRHQAQREDLLVEKLRLGSEEQPARIAQRQPKWRWKPIGFLALILPLLPLMATGADAVVDKACEQAPKCVAAEQQLATA